MLIKNAFLSYGTTADVWVYEGSILAIGQTLTVGDPEVIDAAGRPLLPGFGGLHCHWRPPGCEY